MPIYFGNMGCTGSRHFGMQAFNVFKLYFLFSFCTIFPAAGEIQGTVHRRLLEDRVEELKVGAVLLLKQVGLTASVTLKNESNDEELVRKQSQFTADAFYKTCISKQVILNAVARVTKSNAAE